MIYVSSATKPLSDEDLRRLLEVSRHRNEHHGITGMLLYAAGNFMQVLEGEESDVASTLERIKRDSRHSGLIVLMEGRRDSRDFENWSMGFKRPDLPEELSPVGYSDFMTSPFTGPDFVQDPPLALKLLTLFKEKNR